jgi:lactate dehydrogenase-like 2-hydroxyacid dehydrogenase
MKVVAYSIKTFEKEPLAIANHKQHEITLISNQLSPDTVSFAAGKEAVVVTTEDKVSAAVMGKLADLGVKYIATRSVSTDHIDLDAAALHRIKIAAVPSSLLVTKALGELSVTLATQTILNLNKWEGKGCLGAACVCSRSCKPVASATPATQEEEHHD